MMLVRYITALAMLLTLALAQPARSETACGTPAALNDGWPIDTPENVGLDGARLCGIAARLKAADANVHGVVIVRRGKLVFEQYFLGYDNPWGKPDGSYDFDATTLHDMRSISKSVTSLLLGIAIDRKLIASADEPVLKFFPDYADSATAGWDRITLRHLLTMSSGIAWDESRPWGDPNNDEYQLYDKPDPIRYVLSKPVVAPPDTVWNYNGGGTQLIATIIARLSKMPFDAFAREALFAPLGITEWEWQASKNGTIAAFAGLRLRPRDAAKVGQLVLTGGTWNSKRIASEAWITQSIKPRFQAMGYFGGLFFYGYQWWMGRTLSGERDVPWIAGVGRGGQRLFIVPSADLVVMSTSGLYTSPRQGHAALDMLYSSIFPALRN
jgi:CubicO group peptidase (beta-lactamase class C family)